MNKFYRDLNTAQQYENWYGSTFIGTSAFTTNDDYRYDIKSKNTNETYEVKTDLTTSATWNVCIETSSRGKTSGPEKTEADNFVFIFPFINRVITMPTKQLLEMMDDYDDKIRKVVGGDDNTSELSLIDLGTFAEAIQQYEGTTIQTLNIPIFYPESAVKLTKAKAQNAYNYAKNAHNPLKRRYYIKLKQKFNLQ